MTVIFDVMVSVLTFGEYNTVASFATLSVQEIIIYLVCLGIFIYFVKIGIEVIISA